MKLHKIATAGMAVAAFLTIAACGDSGGSGGDETTAATTASTTAATSADGGVSDPSKPPSAVTLNGLLEKALDPAVPNSAKTALVQGSSADPKLFDKLVTAKKQNPDVTYVLQAPVIATGPGQATVKVKVTVPQQPALTVEAQIIYDQGKWKLAKSTVCLLLQTNKVASPMCPAQAN
ncbi:hypothetical protein [Williamsia sp. CHRR-6]|uniref:hypothetical protein n=1 Tax=Williamsia sp. CHRR-6 TaxID=2835871 RepID=UPI0027DDC952|nr:hypothetical protein [Williamsia sp. CHRR-6]